MCNHLNDNMLPAYSSLRFLVGTQNYSVKIQSEIYALHVHCAVKRIFLRIDGLLCTVFQ